MIRWKAIILAVVIICAAQTGAAASHSPTDAIRTTVDAILHTMGDKSLSGDDKKDERRERIGSLIKTRFDFEEMSKRSLAKHWKDRTPEEQQEFVSIFSELLESSYIGKIELYTNQRINYDKEVIKKANKYAVVSTTVLTDEVDIPIDYKVILKDGQWMVYDVVIEGVSFISTYRSQYNKIIMKDKFPGLIQKMKDKLNELKAEDQKATYRDVAVPAV